MEIHNRLKDIQRVSKHRSAHVSVVDTARRAAATSDAPQHPGGSNYGEEDRKGGAGGGDNSGFVSDGKSLIFIVVGRRRGIRWWGKWTCG
jgi:hypothetical protein